MSEEVLLKAINELLVKLELKLAQKGVYSKAYLRWIKEDETYCTMPNEIDAVILTVDFISISHPEKIINLCSTMAYDDVENAADAIYAQMKHYIKKYSRFIIRKDFEYALRQYNINVAKINKLSHIIKKNLNAKNLIIGLIAIGLVVVTIDLIRRFFL
jgi:hypothetical protein